MNDMTKIPNGDDSVMVELTIKELMALTGVKFRSNPSVEQSARRKLSKTLESVYERQIGQPDSIPYHLLK